ncbi:Uncharacterised protein [Bordetella pertussis]|nr:Uncharacterised protein [Bordetella pertussis]
MALAGPESCRAKLSSPRVRTVVPDMDKRVPPPPCGSWTETPNAPVPEVSMIRFCKKTDAPSAVLSGAFSVPTRKPWAWLPLVRMVPPVTRTSAVRPVTLIPCSDALVVAMATSPRNAAPPSIRCAAVTAAAPATSSRPSINAAPAEI